MGTGKSFALVISLCSQKLLSLKSQIRLTGMLNGYCLNIYFVLLTSLTHVTTFADSWVAKPGFDVIFLSKHVNETLMAMHSTSEN